MTKLNLPFSTGGFVITGKSVEKKINIICLFLSVYSNILKLSLNLTLQMEFLISQKKGTISFFHFDGVHDQFHLYIHTLHEKIKLACLREWDYALNKNKFEELPLFH